MGASAKRRQARQALHVPATPSRAGTALQAVPAPEPVINEIDFLSLPGPLLGVGQLSNVNHIKATSLKMPATLHAHVKTFLSGEPGMSLQTATQLLWRCLLREEHHAREAAMALYRQTGVPTLIEHGPIYTAMQREKAHMAEEEE